jgi:Flp pilus assembly protein TadG
MKAQTRNCKGQCLAEAAVAAIFLIPIVLAIIDLSTMVICNSINDDVAKNAARAAANLKDPNAGQAAAQQVVNAVQKSSIIQNVQLIGPTYSNGSVTVQSKMDVHLPVAMVGMHDQTFVAQSVQPLLAAQ